MVLRCVNRGWNSFDGRSVGWYKHIGVRVLGGNVMDPITIAVLAALAGGVGGEVGRQAWASLTAVVRRRPNPVPDRAHAPGSADPERRAGEVGDVPVGESELTALENAPAERGAVGAGPA